MNMQAMMQQAQKMQKDLVNAKKEVETQIFVGKSSLIEVEVSGKKEIVKVKINTENQLEKEDLEMLEDMFMVATNEAISLAEKAMNDKMEKINPGLSGLI